MSKPFSLARFYGSGNTLQLIDLDEYLALLNYRSDHEVRLVNGKRIRRPMSGRIMVVAVATGEVVHESTIQPTLEPREISQTELASTWDRLGDEDLGDLDSMMWSMAAGGNITYEYLLTKYAKQPPALDAVEIALLLKDLDDNRFSVRNEAFKELQEAGSSIEPMLKRLLEIPDTSSEVRERLRSLIQHWSSGQPQTDEERRQVRGLEVLSRIGSQEATEFLASIRGNEYDSVIRRYAGEILNGNANGAQGNPALQFQRELFVPRR